MRVDPRIEKSARTMIGHVIRQEFDDLEAEIHAVGDEVYRGVLTLCVMAAGYIAIDVSERWPTEADLREIARHTANSAQGIELLEQAVYTYLSRAALGPERLDQVFSSAEDVAGLPLSITSTMLLAFLPTGKHWWEYLDVIWNALNTADTLDPSLLPALMLNARSSAVPQAQ
jgi:hypothetical protein